MQRGGGGFDEITNNKNSSKGILLELVRIYLLDMGAEDLNIPAGTLNLTQTEKPELQLLLTLQEDDVRTGNKKTFMRVYADVWDLVELSGQMLKLTYT